ncbi:hypothetical protein ScPMuIL_004927 [Solemya velum]
MALLDTGSTVSTISEDFYREHLHDVELHALESILSIECADGQLLPYSGYVVVDLVLSGIPSNQTQECLLLVVPNSNYNRSVPVLLGTNVLCCCMTKCQQLCGDKLLQHSSLSSAWHLAFKSLMMRERHLRRNKNRIALVRSAQKQNFVIQPNSSTVVEGFIDRKVDYHTTCVMLQPTEKATISEDLDITPGLIDYHSRDSELVQVHLANVTTRPITIPARAILCEIQPVALENFNTHATPSDKQHQDSLFEKLDISSELDAKEIGRVKQLISQYEDIFSMRLHDDVGHPGRDRTLSLLQDRFYWPNMKKDVEDWLKKCGRCIRWKTQTNIRAELVNITTQYPLELVCLDFLTLETSKGGYSNLLVITDHFTRYAQAFPTRNQTAKTTAEVFYNNFVVHYGLPKRIHSDQGGCFESTIVRELCALTGIQKSRTTPYHAMGNGQCERFNRSLLSLLGTLEHEKKANWKSHVGPLVHAYNCTRHETTRQSPFVLMFGREPRLPIDLAFGIDRHVSKEPTTSYAKQLRDRLQKSYELASTAAKKAQLHQKKYYDTKARAGHIEPTDRVLRFAKKVFTTYSIQGCIEVY